MGFGQGQATPGTADVVLGAPVDLTLLLVAIGLAVAGGLIAGSARRAASSQAPSRRRAEVDRMMYRLRGVSKRYGDVTAVDAIDFEVGEGEFLWIMGPSGCGKSTVLNLIAGLDDPTSGPVEVADRKLATLSERARSDLACATSASSSRASTCCRASPSSERRVALLERSACAGERTRPHRRGARAGGGRVHRMAALPDELSGGEQQRVAAARALARSRGCCSPTSRPATSTPRRAGSVLALIESVRDQRGTTIVLVTNDPDVAEAADRLVGVRDGRLLEPLAA